MFLSTHDFYKYSSGRQIGMRSILLLGTANDGPVNFPTKVTNFEHAKSIFGEETEGNLLSACRIVFDNITSDSIVYLMRVSGKEARAELLIEEVDEETVKQKIGIGFRSYHGGKQYNSILIYASLDEETNEPFLLFYNAETEQQSNTYWLNQYKTVSELCQHISEDTRNGKGWVLAYTNIPKESIQSIIPNMLNEMSFENEFYLEGGESGVDICKDEYFLALENAYELLHGFYCDVVVPVEAYFDDTYPRNFYGDSFYFNQFYAKKRDYIWLDDENKKPRMFHKQLIDFCQKQMRFGFMPHGVMGFYPITDPREYTQHPYSLSLARVLNSPLSTREGMGEKQFDNVIDKGYFISVVMGDFLDKNENLIPGYLVYASLLLNLKIEDTTTNQPIPNQDKYRLIYEFETKEIEKLSELGVVTFRNNRKKGLVVSNGCTCSIPTSPFHWYSNVRQSQIVFSMLYESLKDFEGRTAPFQILIREAREIGESVLKELKKANVVLDYNLNITMDSLNEMYVEVELQPKYAVEFIKVSGYVPLLK
ncbi:MAG: hypothetical protein N2043_02240 [Ignavibacterium sp.]|nr:hypothetical protein [Ignavibacterium sp.]